jgi:hypothetical protein
MTPQVTGEDDGTGSSSSMKFVDSGGILRFSPPEMLATAENLSPAANFNQRLTEHLCNLSQASGIELFAQFLIAHRRALRRREQEDPGHKFRRALYSGLISSRQFGRALRQNRPDWTDTKLIRLKACAWTTLIRSAGWTKLT